jgi:LPXTG-site transpeptidase (sortase) family protein
MPAVKAAVKFMPDISRPKPKSVPTRQQHSSVLARQFVSVKKQKRRNSKKMNLRGLALASLAVMLFAFGLTVGIVQLNTNKQVKAQVKTLAAHTAAASSDGTLPDNGVPSETRPTGGNWRPAADEPKWITIPSLDVTARVIKVGTKDDGEIKTPNNIFDIGWLETSAKPGQNGAMFLDGHVHGPTEPGTFYNIKKLKAGDKITIERGDGQELTYSVVRSETYDKNNVDMVAALNTAVPGKPGLNLITCDGKYSADSGYDHRIMVFAVLD